MPFPDTTKLTMKPTRIVATALLAAAVGMSAQTAPAPAGNAAPGSATQVMEAFTVTGSNIRRLDEERTLPVTVIEREEMAAFAAPTASELLSMLPNGGVISLGEANVLGADARGDNTALNLRGIGSGNTLVLLNGRRLAPHPISQAEGGVPSLAVNVNQLPTAAVERIEVLRDGASAIYGADAAAGVVNTILRRNYDGYEFSVRGSATERGGASDWRVTLSGGENYNGGRTNVVSMLDYYHRDFLGTRDRRFSRDSDIRRVGNLPAPWNGLPFVDANGTTVRDNDFDNRSSASVYGNFVRGSFDAAANFVGVRPAGNAGITTSTTPSTTLTASTAGLFFLTPLASGATGFRQSTPSRNWDGVEKDYYYNLNEHRTILPRTDRINFFTALDHKLDDRLAAFGELAYYRADSWLTRDPAGTDGTDDFNLHVGANNPWNPFGSRFYHPTGAPNSDGTLRITGAPSDVLIAGSTGVRPREFKAKEVEVLSQSLRGLVGLRGKTFADFEWESGLMYSRAWTRDEEKWNIRHSLLQQALLRTDATAFNPFGYRFRVANNQVEIDQAYTNPDNVVNPLYDVFIREGTTELATLDAKLNGSILNFPGGRIGAAIGAEVRWESYKDWRPSFHGLNPAGYVLPAPGSQPGDNDFIGLSPNLNLYSDRNIISSYAELLFPVVGAKNRKPLVDLLEVSVAGRYEKFSDFGDAFKPKYALAWRPGRNLLVRASYNESFRAPNLVQTNTQPLQRSVSGVSDPYRFEVTSLIGDGSVSRTVFRQGNASLAPEESRISTVGFALEVPKIKGLTVTVDWWRIDQNGVIDNLTASGQLLRDEQVLDALSQAAIAAGQNPGALDVGSGTSTYQGNPKINRAPVTQADRDAYAAFNAARPASQRRVPVGRVLSVVDDYLNVAGRDVEGVDVALSYRLPRFAFGQFSLRAGGTFTNRRDEQLDEFSEVETVLREDGRARWRANASVTWRHGSWTSGWFTEYYGGFMDPGAATTAAVYDALGRPDYIRVFNDIGGVVRYRWWIKETYQHNVYLQYRYGRVRDFRRNVTVRAGVGNLFDEAPPVADESRGYQGGTISAKGRNFYVELSKKF